MGQIVKGKKKGRPSKADLARRVAAAATAETAAEMEEVRRSRRRRNVRYNFDFDDYIEDEEEDDDGEDAWRREKKLKLLLKLQQQSSSREGGSESTRRVAHAPDGSASSSEYGGGGDGDNLLKKRRIDDDDDANDIDEEDEEEVRGRQAGLKGADSVPGTPPDPPMGFSLPDKKSLELILDKLQKKDIYGVYAEPVDPEELPDYHDVIEHPMDFGTVRKKLGNGSYSTLKQFESDVFLICTNAMQYNAPDTIYYKQARSIQELAQRKFQRLRIEAERPEKELKSEHITRSDSPAKKQIKKPMSRTEQEPVGSDFSAGATLATAGDFQSGSGAMRAGGLERLSNVDGPVGGNTSLSDNNLEKAEDLSSGRGLLSRLGRKPHMHDENRRATYNISNQPVSRSESIFATFDGEIKQLVTVGLHADHSYARSLARFAGALGPVAWKVASKRIEQALPQEFKFGRGWIGDYEPLPTPVLMLDNCSQKDPPLLTNLHSTPGDRKDDKTTKTAPVSAREHPVSVPTSKGNPSFHGAAAAPSSRVANLEGKQPFFCSGGSRAATTASVNHQQQSPRPRNIELEKKVTRSVESNYQQQRPRSRTIESEKNVIKQVETNYQQPSPRSRNIEPEKKAMMQVELNRPPHPTNHNTSDFVAEKQNATNVPASRSMETVPRNRNHLQSAPPKQPENNGFMAGGLLNGKVATKSLDRNRMATSPFDGIPNQTATAANFAHGQQQGLSDPVQQMKMLAENSQRQQKSLNQSSPVDYASVPSSRSEDSNNAAAAAARAWMSIGSGGYKPATENTSTHMNQMSVGSLHNPTRELQPQVSPNFPGFGMHFQPPKNSFPLQAFMTPAVGMGSEAQFQNRPMCFPQLVTADLSRFQVLSPRQGLSPQKQPRQKQESVPPDLNQQPDLALQL